MFDSIDPRSPTPLYEQIGACVRVAIAAGELTPGEALPSVRQLAGALRINPATVSQAYRELARDGFVEMKHGAGTFVRNLPAPRKEEELLLQARGVVRRALVAAARLGVSADALLKVLAAEVSAATSGGEGRIDGDGRAHGRGAAGGDGKRRADETLTLTEVGE